MNFFAILWCLRTRYDFLLIVGTTKMLNAAVARATARADTLKKLQSAFGGAKAVKEVREDSKKREAPKEAENNNTAFSERKRARVEEKRDKTPRMGTKMKKGKAVDAVMSSIGA